MIEMTKDQMVAHLTLNDWSPCIVMGGACNGQAGIVRNPKELVLGSSWHVGLVITKRSRIQIYTIPDQTCALQGMRWIDFSTAMLGLLVSGT